MNYSVQQNYTLEYYHTCDELRKWVSMLQNINLGSPIIFKCSDIIWHVDVNRFLNMSLVQTCCNMHE